MTPDEKVLAAAQRYGDELHPRTISGFAARTLPLGSVLVRIHDDGTLADEAVVKVPGGWWSIDAPVAEPLAGDLQFRVLHVPGGSAVEASPLPPRASWRARARQTVRGRHDVTAPDRPTREQVDYELARVDDEYVCSDERHRVLAAEVRALRAELEQADHFGRGEFRVTTWAYEQAVRVMREAKDEATALVARTPQPAETVLVGDPCPCNGPDGVHEAGTGRDRGECRYCDGTIAAAPLPAVPDGEDATDLLGALQRSLDARRVRGVDG